MGLLALPPPKWLELARLLAQITHPAWPPSSGDHFSDRAFNENTCEVSELSDKHNFITVGCGNFTAVFTHSSTPDHVYKLNAGTRDKMEEFHRWLMEQDHPNLPCVYHVESFKGGCVAVCEMLESYGDMRELPFEELTHILNVGGFEVDDVHGGNVMHRAGVPVLNDPSSNRPDGGEYYSGT